MADETLGRIFGTILCAFCSKYLGQALQGIAEKVRPRRLRLVPMCGPAACS